MSRQQLNAPYSMLWVFLLLSACTAMSHFDRQSYIETISIKVESLALVEKASMPYSDFQKEAEDILIEVAKVYEYEKHRPKNSETIQMWETMLDPERNLLAGFLAKWENEGQLSEVFIKEARLQIEKGFDLIIDLENNKVKPESAESQILQWS